MNVAGGLAHYQPATQNLTLTVCPCLQSAAHCAYFSALSSMSYRNHAHYQGLARQ
jgi:hypothetical protein